VSQSLLYHAFGVREGYEYVRTEYRRGTAGFHLTVAPCLMVCPHCQGREIIRKGKRFRRIQTVPIGFKAVFLNEKLDELRRVRVREAVGTRRQATKGTRYYSRWNWLRRRGIFAAALFSTIMRQITDKAVVALLGCLLAAAMVSGQAAEPDGGWQWHDARGLVLEGKGWRDTRQYYDRLPGRAEGIVRGAVWGLSQDSAGLAVRFVTDATAISARWTLRSERLAMAHMPASGVSGVDLYVKDKGRWRWLGAGRAEKYPTEEKTLARELPPMRREYLLYLPLYNGVTEVQIGLPAGAKLEAAPAREPGRKPVVFYGTSILQGGCAARPGMAYPAILGRRLDREAINLGFSGNAWGEPEMARLLAELDPAAYVLDPLPNMKEEWVAPRLREFVAILRKAHPRTPIVLVEHAVYPDSESLGPQAGRCARSNARLRELHRQWVRAGDRRLWYVSGAGLTGDDREGTVDGVHATDLGFYRMAGAIEPTLRRALKFHR